MRDAHFEKAAIAMTELLKTALETLLESYQRITALLFALYFVFVVLLQQILRHGRHNRTREQVGRQHGEDYRFSQGYKEVFGHAGQEEHRHEDDADGDRGNEGRDRNLRSAVENGLLDGFSHLNIAVDVFDLDRGVIDQNADGERQSAERHDVDGLAQRAQYQQRRQNGERNRDRDNQRAAPASQKDKDHDPGQAGGNDGLTHNAVNRAAHEDRLVGQGSDFQRRGELGLNVRQLRANAFCNVQRRSIAGLDDGQQRSSLAVDAHDIGLRRKAVAYMRHIADINHCAVDGTNRQVIQLGYSGWSAVGFNLIFELRNLDGA